MELKLPLFLSILLVWVTPIQAQPQPIQEIFIEVRFDGPDVLSSYEIFTLEMIVKAPITGGVCTLHQVLADIGEHFFQLDGPLAEGLELNGVPFTATIQGDTIALSGGLNIMAAFDRAQENTDWTLPGLVGEDGEPIEVVKSAAVRLVNVFVRVPTNAAMTGAGQFVFHLENGFQEGIDDIGDLLLVEAELQREF